jgi:hypothetical protein
MAALQHMHARILDGGLSSWSPTPSDLAWLADDEHVDVGTSAITCDDLRVCILRAVSAAYLGQQPSPDDASLHELLAFLDTARAGATPAARQAASLIPAAVEGALREVVRARVAQVAGGAEGEDRILPGVMAWGRTQLLPLAAALVLGTALLPSANSVDADRRASDARVAAAFTSQTCAVHSPFAGAAMASVGEAARTGALHPAPPSLGMSALGRLDEALFAALHGCTAGARSEAIFDLVRDFPDSRPALEDIRDGLAGCGGAACEELQASFVGRLVTTLGARVLHPGVPTSSIVEVFLSAVRACRLIDSSGTLAALACEPTRAYLRARPDTVRCIIASLTEDTDSALHAELQARTGRLLVYVGVGGDGDEDEEGEGARLVAPVESECEESEDGMAEGGISALLPQVLALLATRCPIYLPGSDGGDAGGRLSEWGRPSPAAPRPAVWFPRPADAEVIRALRSGGGVIGAGGGGEVDLLACLVGIFGSGDAFVAEYRSVLGEKLLGRGAREWDLTGEERVLELLKLRFGEGALSSHEVMLKDMTDSKRASAGVAGRGHALLAGRGLDVLALSAHYWPGMTAAGREGGILAPQLSAAYGALAEGYAEVKKPRVLTLLPSLGSVLLDVEEVGADGVMRTREVRGTVSEASLLCFMAGSPPSLPLPVLADLAGLSRHAALKHVVHWVAEGVLALRRGEGGEEEVWLSACLQERKGSGRAAAGGGDGGAGWGAVAGDGGQGDDPQAAQVWCSYLTGMLSNLGPLPLDRIHSTLKMFASLGEHPFEKGAGDTARFLSDQVRAGLLAYSDGLYSLQEH